MSIIVPPFATNFELTIPAGGAVSAFSQGAFSVLVQNPPSSNIPPVWSKLADVGAGAGTYTSATFAAGALVRIDASGGSSVSVDVGLSPGPKLERVATAQGVTVTAVNASATLTTAQMAGGVISSTSAAAVAATLPTGAVMDTQGVQAIGEGFYWLVDNTGPSAFTVTAAASGHTVASGVVAATSSAQFFTLKTAAATYRTYRA